jgi:hypothetical protein
MMEVHETERLQVLPVKRSAVPPQDRYEPTDIYQKLVIWYHTKSNSLHVGALIFVGLLNFAELFWVLCNPGGPGAPLPAPGTCTGPLSGYGRYTPVYWVVALVTGLISLFVLRYSHPFDAEGKSERAGNQIREAMLSSTSQWVIIVVSVGLLIVEFIGIMTNTFTISSKVRDFSIQNTWAYWLGGNATAFLCGQLIDLQRIPRLIRFMLVVWVAVLSHIFWWITPK